MNHIIDLGDLVKKKIMLRHLMLTIDITPIVYFVVDRPRSLNFDLASDKWLRRKR